MRVWEAWRDNRNYLQYSVPTLLEMDLGNMSHWLERFTLEARKVDGTEYQPNSIYHIVCGIMRYIRIQKQGSIDFFKDPEFAGLRSSLDGEMKRLQSKGLGSTHKLAEPFTMEEEDILWGKNILGDHSPETLLNTMVYMNGLYFALRSGDDLRLRVSLPHE